MSGERGMRGPFRYQAAAGDCFPTSVVNALVALHPPDRIPSFVIQRVYLYSLDVMSRHTGGTSDQAGRFLCHWLDSYSQGKFRVAAEFLAGAEVHLRSNNRLVRWLDRGGVAICDVKCERNGWHSILALEADREWIYFWDPNFRSRAPRSTRDAELLKPGNLGEPNLRIRRSWLAKASKRPFTLGPVRERCAILIGRR